MDRVLVSIWLWIAAARSGLVLYAGFCCMSRSAALSRP